MADLICYVKQLLDQMDLRVKAANFSEAHSSAKQGHAIVVFTVVSTIFV
jgi:hypothetical protein